MKRIQSTKSELIPQDAVRACGLELRGDHAALFGYPDGLTLYECLWYAVRNAVLDQSRQTRGMQRAS